MHANPPPSAAPKPKQHIVGLRWLLGFGLLLLTLLAILVYSPVLHATFLWDDEFLVQKNPFIRSPILAIEVFRHFLFTDARGEFYRPVQNWSYMFDYWRAGLTPLAYHQTNLWFHCLNGLFVFVLGSRLIRILGNTTARQAWLLGFCLAAYWLLHPIHSAIVAYVSGRADSLALSFLLIGWFGWEWSVNTVAKYRGVGFILAIAFALLGCCSKEIGLVGLGFFLLYLWIVRIDLPKPLKINTSLGLIGVLMIYLTLRHLPAPNISPGGDATVPWSIRAELCIRAMGDYGRLFIYPEKLFMERQVGNPTGLFTDPVRNDPLFPYLGWMGMVFLLALFVSLAWQGKARQLRVLGVFWFVAFILPVSNLLPLNATVAEHWLYIPSIGLGLWAVGCWLDSKKMIRRICAIIFPLALALLGQRAHERAQDWHDPETFYLATVRAGGDSVRMRMNLAAEYQKKGNLNETDRIYRSILKVLPDFALAKIGLAQNLNRQNRATEARDLFQGLAQKKEAGVVEQVANIERLTKLNDTLATDTARDAYEKNPNSWALAVALSNIYLEHKQPKVSFALTQGFAERNWWHAESHLQLAKFFEADGQPTEALRVYREAARLDLHDEVVRAKIRKLEANH